MTNEYDTFPVSFQIGGKEHTVFFVTKSNESRIQAMGYSWGADQNMSDDIKSNSDHYVDGGVFPPSVPGALRAFWATLVAGRDLSDAREVLSIAQGVLRVSSLPADAQLQLIDGMMWERDRIIALSNPNPFYREQWHVQHPRPHTDT